MASLQNTRQRNVCFGNICKRQRLRSIQSPESSNETFTSDNSNSRLTKGQLHSDASNRIPSTPKFSNKHRRSCERRPQDFESDSDSNGGPVPRPRFFFFCFGWRRSRNCKKQHTGNQTTKAKSKTRLLICDESVTDIPDSNITTRSAAIDCSNDDTDGCQRRSRSRASSFYSAISFRSDEDWNRIRSNRTYNLPEGCVDDDDDFFSALEGDDFDYETIKEASKVIIPIRLDDVCLSSDGSTAAPLSLPSLCPCGSDFHKSVYRPDFPLITGPGISPDSHEECVALSNACKGCWETIVDRSETLDPQYRCIGLGMLKRSVMNRLAIPLTMFLEENDAVFHCWIHTPLGIRHMRSNLYHHESTDDDPDAGRWTGITHVVDFSIPWYCGGKPVRALQQRRQNPSIGTSIETRCVLPDQAEGKIMLFQFVMIPKGKTEKDKLKADRILKYTGPKKD